MHGDQGTDSRDGRTEDKSRVAVGFSAVRYANASNDNRSEGSSEVHESMIR